MSALGIQSALDSNFMKLSFCNEMRIHEKKNYSLGIVRKALKFWKQTNFLYHFLKLYFIEA